MLREAAMLLLREVAMSSLREVAMSSLREVAMSSLREVAMWSPPAVAISWLPSNSVAPDTGRFTPVLNMRRRRYGLTLVRTAAYTGEQHATLAAPLFPSSR